MCRVIQVIGLSAEYLANMLLILRNECDNPRQCGS